MQARSQYKLPGHVRVPHPTLLTRLSTTKSPLGRCDKLTRHRGRRGWSDRTESIPACLILALSHLEPAIQGIRWLPLHTFRRGLFTSNRPFDTPPCQHAGDCGSNSVRNTECDIAPDCKGKRSTRGWSYVSRPHTRRRFRRASSPKRGGHGKVSSRIVLHALIKLENALIFAASKSSKSDTKERKRWLMEVNRSSAGIAASLGCPIAGCAPGVTIVSSPQAYDSIDQSAASTCQTCTWRLPTFASATEWCVENRNNV